MNICGEKCYFYTSSNCRFKKEFNTKYEECDYFIDKQMVLEQLINTAMEMKKIKNMIENPDFPKKMDVFIERSQDLKEPKSLEEHTKKLEENFNELFNGINVFGRAKEEMIEALKDKNRELEKENELLKEIIKGLFKQGCPLHQYVDRDFGLTIEVDNECSIMHLGKFKSIDLDEKLKEVLEK